MTVDHGDHESVVIFSGGMDSATLLVQNIYDHKNPVALSFDYGQRHSKELGYAHLFAQAWHVPHKLVDLSAIKPLIAKGSQTGDEDVPEGHYAEESMKTTVVPNRNMIMLAVAVGHAISIGAREVMYAAHSGDHAIYPDCRSAFVQSMKEAVFRCDWTPPTLVAPYLGMTKADIVKKGMELSIDYKFTWSCYKGELKHCGACGTCVERKEAFQLNGIPDPTEYAA
jgi:7-cyano-7-deazaguanine synthase